MPFNKEGEWQDNTEVDPVKTYIDFVTKLREQPGVCRVEGMDKYKNTLHEEAAAYRLKELDVIDTPENREIVRREIAREADGFLISALAYQEVNGFSTHLLPPRRPSSLYYKTIGD